MTCNVGSRERVVRIVAGVVGLILGIFVYAWAPWLRILLAVVGAVVLVTGLVRYCPVNRLFGIQNCGPAVPEETLRKAA